ncbi:hypothetical protein [Polynucleobacter sp. 39-46-10]|jgi:hypothetical protein|uniref:hypothetical protein n=2 Tax=unclassified Polynucleobacter TaxID=2640945 RepID=UPI000BC90E06|nr:hypothetical protein [Polynucleobacter sp. 39-46-10]OZA77851.1 MAG: hypothetical protein B7X71_03380 [Polynucleobacter sp. 39-46-10]
MNNNQQTEIKNLWIFKTVSPNSILELRAIASNKSPITKIYRADQFIDIDTLQQAFEDEAIKLNQVGYNIYVVMNPIKESFNGQSAKDEDIAHRDLLLIDIDRATASKEPANQAELEAAHSLSEDISTYLAGEGWGEPIKVLSGNGYHLYYKLGQLPNDAKHKGLVESSLKELANRFDTSIVKIDTCVFNASRITKVPGTIAYKGKASLDRPYRMARVLS